MREAGIVGVARGGQADGAHHDRRPGRAQPADLVQTGLHRRPGPDRLWVVDPTYVSTWSGWVYVAFVIDVFSRLIVGWRAAPRCAPTWPWTPGGWPAGRHRRKAAAAGLVHHSDTGHPVLSSVTRTGWPRPG